MYGMEYTVSCGMGPQCGMMGTQSKVHLLQLVLPAQVRPRNQRAAASSPSPGLLLLLLRRHGLLCRGQEAVL